MLFPTRQWLDEVSAKALKGLSTFGTNRRAICELVECIEQLIDKQERQDPKRSLAR